MTRLPSTRTRRPVGGYCVMSSCALQGFYGWRGCAAGEVAQKIQFEAAAALDPGERSADCCPKPSSESHVGNRRLAAILISE